MKKVDAKGKRDIKFSVFTFGLEMDVEFRSFFYLF